MFCAMKEPSSHGHFQTAEICPCHQVTPANPKDRPLTPPHPPTTRPRGLLRLLIATYMFESYKNGGSGDGNFQSSVYQLGSGGLSEWPFEWWLHAINVSLHKILSWNRKPIKTTLNDDEESHTHTHSTWGQKMIKTVLNFWHNPTLHYIRYEYANVLFLLSYL